jgi:hypothetical protein
LFRHRSEDNFHDFAGIEGRALDFWHRNQVKHLQSKSLEVAIRNELVRICEYLLELWKVHQVPIRTADESDS